MKLPVGCAGRRAAVRAGVRQDAAGVGPQMRLTGNTLPPNAAKALAASPLAKRLKVLDAGK
jgi:hypothetical protein